MHYLIAFDKFKGAATAEKACFLAGEAIATADPSATVERVPLTDGGEGFATILANALEGELREIEVTGPRFRPVKGKLALVGAGRIPEPAWARLRLPEAVRNGTIGVVEMASASGYECIGEDERDPWETTSYGTGQLIRAAVEAGASAILLGIGGSATNDCGAGALEALGVSYYDRDLQAVTGVTPSRFKLINTAGSTSHLVDSFPPLRIACDVDNPLVGPNGATRVFGPQKGLKPDQSEQMERAIHKLGGRILGLFGKIPSEWDSLMMEPGSGAAGGIGFALRHALPEASFVDGFPLVAELLALKDKLAAADRVLTGEGRLDKTSLSGKGPVSLLKMAPEGKAVLMFCGRIDPSVAESLQECYPALELIAVSDPSWPLEKALAQTAMSLQRAVTNALSSR
jgi:glycerate kinase